MSKRNKYIVIAVVVIAIIGFFVIRSNGNSVAGDERLQLEITSPASRTSLTDATVMVTGIISNATANVRVNDEPVVVSADGGFSHDVQLEYGNNRISIQADGDGFISSTRTVTVPREMVLEVLEPAQDSVSNVDSITVHGTISDLAATIMVAGTDVPVAEDGTWSMELRLYYPLTIINVTATRDGIAPITQLISITRTPA